MHEKERESRRRYVAALAKSPMLLRDLDLDAFVDGVLAHRRGQAFHTNPHGDAGDDTIERLSWHMGWNERALQTQHIKPAIDMAVSGDPR